MSRFSIKIGTKRKLDGYEYHNCQGSQEQQQQQHKEDIIYKLFNHFLTTLSKKGSF